jgi:hypothetical protein
MSHAGRCDAVETAFAAPAYPASRPSMPRRPGRASQFAPDASVQRTRRGDTFDEMSWIEACALIAVVAACVVARLRYRRDGS